MQCNARQIGILGRGTQQASVQRFVLFSCSIVACSLKAEAEKAKYRVLNGWR